MWKKRVLTLLLFSALLFVMACDDGDLPFPPKQDKARVMVVHASPDAPGVAVGRRIVCQKFGIPQ